MDFELSEQQAAFRDLMRDFARKSIAPVAREWELAGRYPEEIVDEMKAMGLFGMLVPEEYGGIAIDAVSYSRRVRGDLEGVDGRRRDPRLALAGHPDAGEVRHAGAAAPLAAGPRHRQAAIGHRADRAAGRQRPAGHHDRWRSATATTTSSTASKTWITNARHADPLPVLVKTDPNAQPRHRGMTVLMIEQGTPGFTVGKDLDKLGYKGPESSEVFLSDCRVPVENLLGGEEGHGLQQALSALEFGRVNIAGRAVGVAQASLDRSLAYARERHAFGRPIAEFQAIQLKLADMATEVQAARLLTWWAASALDSGRRADLETGMAKLYASEVCIKASLEAMRIHGGYGYSTEYEIERFYRDAPLMAIGEGTNDILRTVIARQLVRGDGG